MDLEGLGGLTMHVILSKLAPQDAASVACVSKRFRNWSSDELLWSRFCADDLDLSSPLDPLGNPMPSFKWIGTYTGSESWGVLLDHFYERKAPKHYLLFQLRWNNALNQRMMENIKASYQTWREAFNLYPWPLVTRVKRCWGRLKEWLAINFPEVLSTLRKGATEDEILELEKSLKVKLPLPTRVLYRFYDGQELTSEESSGSVPGNLLGLIGGYSFYDHLVNVSLLPLHQMIIETKEIIRHLGFGNRSKYVVVAASCSYNEKIFFLNCSNGQLYVGTRNLTTDGEMLPCVPNALINSVHDVKGTQQQDAMLLWLEEHVRRLQHGMIKVRKEGKVRSICLFPEEPPLCSLAVTNGVKVRASSVFVPEFSNIQDESEKFLFAYSIRMSLSPEGCIMNGLTFNSCQLYWRRWIIRCNDIIVDDVNGEAVIGKFPLLRPGEEEFVYESCTAQSSSPGSIEGAFTFVPGRLADPKGSPFEAVASRFPLLVPDYIF